MAATLAFHTALAGAPRPEVVALGRRAIGDDAAYLADLDAGYPHIYAIGSLGLVYELTLPERRLDTAIGRALERGSLVGAVIALFFRANLRRLTGRLMPALDDARSALDHATHTNEPWLIAMSVCALTETLVELGQLDDARAALAEIPTSAAAAALRDAAVGLVASLS
jgi:hypothetical protein